MGKPPCYCLAEIFDIRIILAHGFPDCVRKLCDRRIIALRNLHDNVERFNVSVICDVCSYSERNLNSVLEMCIEF